MGSDILRQAKAAAAAPEKAEKKPDVEKAVVRASHTRISSYTVEYDLSSECSDLSEEIKARHALENPFKVALNDAKT